MRYLYMYIASMLYLGLMFGTLNVLAHSTGISLEKTVGEYNVDIGQDPPGLEAASPAFFDFDLIVEETGERAEFSDIWVRIVQGKKTVFASGIHKPDFGNTTLVYTFPEDGEYELSVRYQKDGENVAEASFPLEVASGRAGGGSSVNGFWLVLGVLGGAVAGFLGSSLLKKQ